MCDEVRLVRNDLGLTPWGFRITGGRDFGTPLLVVKVVGGSIAALAGVQVGDLIRGINYVPTNDFTHLDAQRAILESGDILILNLLKGGEYEAPEPPQIPVIDIQSPEDKEVEEIEQQNEDLEMSFVIHLNRSGRISAVEEVPTPNPSRSGTPTSKRSTPTARRKSSGGSSSSHSNKTPNTEESDRKGKMSITVNDDGPINIQPPSYEDATKSKSTEKKESLKQQEVTLTEEMRMETTMKKTTTEIKERTEEDFVMGVRDEILARAHKEKRELTEEEIAEMMAGEAEVIEARKGKEVIGVNFQKFIPKCDFIKDSEVFKVLQEEQTKKDKSEVEQLETDPLKRFSKFLIKPKTAKPIPKPKPIKPDLLPWQERLNSPAVPEQTAASTQPIIVDDNKSKETETKSSNVEKSTVVESNETKKEEHKLEKNEESEHVTVSTEQKSEEHLSLKIQKNEKQEYNEEIRKREDETEKAEDKLKSEADDELESIEWKESKKRGSIEKSSQKRRSSEDGRRSKTKKVGFIGLECKEDIEKQLAEIQKELLTLQRLPLEIQNHLLVVQQSLQDIVAQRSQMQTPENDEEKIEATEVYTYNQESDENEGADENIIEKKFNDIAENENKDEQQIETKFQSLTTEEVSLSEKTNCTTEESTSETSVKSEQHEIITSSNESKSEEIVQIKEDENNKEIKDEIKKEKDLTHGQEDVEICESKVKPALPLTPQMRPLVLPGGRKWVQPKDAYTEEYIAETLVSQSEVLVGTTIGINFRKYIPPKFDSSNSSVYRMIHEIEDRAKKGVAERPEKVHALDEFYHPPIDKRHFYNAQLAHKKHVDNLFQQSNGPTHH